MSSPFLLVLIILVAITISTADMDKSDLFNIVRKIALHNQNPNNTFQLRFSDISLLVNPDEYQRRLGFRMPSIVPNSTQFKVPEGFKAPDFIDWREKGVVTRVKDQGNCGSCWAFSTTGALEGQYALKRKQLIELSEQNLLDCANEKYGNYGCEGGNQINSYLYIGDNGGIDTEASYPYVTKKGTCNFNNETVGANLKGFGFLFTGDEDILKNAVAYVGPIAVMIDAGQFSFQHYGGGVYNDPKCPVACGPGACHAVLIVGYGTDSEGGDYWIVKNSWNTAWGEQGYIRMARNRENQCGISSFASYPIVSCEGNDCNRASRASLLVAILATAVAALQYP